MKKIYSKIFSLFIFLLIIGISLSATSSYSSETASSKATVFIDIIFNPIDSTLEAVPFCSPTEESGKLKSYVDSTPNESTEGVGIGLPITTQLTRVESVSSETKPLEWKTLIEDFVSTPPATKRTARIYFDIPVTCVNFQNNIGRYEVKFFYPEETASVQLTQVSTIKFSPDVADQVSTTMMDPGCTQIKYAESSSLQEYVIVLINDQGLEDILQGNNGWPNVPLTPEQKDELFKALVYDTFLNYETQDWRNVSVYFLDSPTNYTHCEISGGCNQIEFVNEAIQGCSLPSGVYYNIALLHGIGANTTTGPFGPSTSAGIFLPAGYANLGAQEMVVNVGTSYINAIQPIMGLSPLELNSRMKSDVEYRTKQTLIHELGHAKHFLDHHLACNSGIPGGSPTSMCHNILQNCEAQTQAMCELAPGTLTPASPITRADSSVDLRHSYMRENVFDTFSADDEYKRWGDIFMHNVVRSSNQRHGVYDPRNSTECGNGKVELGEDRDPRDPYGLFSSSIRLPYRSDKNLYHVQSCISVLEPREEIKRTDALGIQASSTNAENYWRNTVRNSLYANLLNPLGRVTLDATTCRLNIPCVHISAEGIVSRERGNFAPPMVDCNSVDYRIQKGTSTTDFVNQLCNVTIFNPFFDGSVPPFEKATNNIGVAYSDYPNVFLEIYNPDGVQLSKTTVALANGETIVKVGFLEGSQSQRSPWEYDPVNNTSGLLNGLHHPFGAYIVTNENIRIYNVDSQWSNGFESTPWIVDNVGSGSRVAELLDAGFHEGSKEFFVTYVLNDNSVYQARYPTQTSAGTPTRNFITPDVNRVRPPNHVFKTGEDSQTPTSVGYISPGSSFYDLKFVQYDRGVFSAPFERLLKPETHTILPLLTGPKMQPDALGRYEFIWYEQGAHSGLMDQVTGTLKAEGMLITKRTPIALPRSWSSYPISNNNLPEFDLSLNGTHSAVPFAIDNTLAYVDPSQGGFEVKVPYLSGTGDQSQYYSMSVMQEVEMGTRGSQYVVDNVKRRVVILTRQQNALGDQDIILSLQKDEGSVEFDEFTIGSTTSEFKHLAVKATSAGAHKFANGRLSCTDQQTVTSGGAVLGFLSDHQGIIQDEHEGYFLLTYLDPTEGSKWQVWWTGEDGFYGTTDDQMIYDRSEANIFGGSNYLVNHAQVRKFKPSPRIPPGTVPATAGFTSVPVSLGLTLSQPSGSTTTQPGAPVTVEFTPVPVPHLYFEIFNTTTIQEFGVEVELLTENVQIYNLSLPQSFHDDQLVGSTYFLLVYDNQTQTTKLTECDITNCQFLETFTFPERTSSPNQVNHRFSGETAIAYEGYESWSGKRHLYIIDQYGWHTYPIPGPLRFMDEGNDQYRVVYKDPSLNDLTIETLLTNTGSVSSINKIQHSPLVPVGSQDRITGRVISPPGGAEVFGIQEQASVTNTKVRTNAPVVDGVCSASSYARPFSNLNVNQTGNFIAQRDNISGKIKVFKIELK